jgi:hypothetical protein
MPIVRRTRRTPCAPDTSFRLSFVRSLQGTRSTSRPRPKRRECHQRPGSTAEVVTRGARAGATVVHPMPPNDRKEIPGYPDIVRARARSRVLILDCRLDWQSGGEPPPPRTARRAARGLFPTQAKLLEPPVSTHRRRVRRAKGVRESTSIPLCRRRTITHEAHSTSGSPAPKLSKTRPR